MLLHLVTGVGYLAATENSAVETAHFSSSLYALILGKDNHVHRAKSGNGTLAEGISYA